MIWFLEKTCKYLKTPKNFNLDQGKFLCFIVLGHLELFRKFFRIKKEVEESDMEQTTTRSPNLAKLYNKKTDCVLEWVCTLLNEDDKIVYSDIKSYFNDYLAYSKEFDYLLDFYFEHSLSSIRKLQSCADKLNEIDALYSDKIKSLAQVMRMREHSKVEDLMKEFFSACDLIHMTPSQSEQMVS